MEFLTQIWSAKSLPLGQTLKICIANEIGDINLFALPCIFFLLAFLQLPILFANREHFRLCGNARA